MPAFKALMTVERPKLFAALAEASASGRPIALFGAGAVGQWAARNMLRRGIRISAFCDNDPRAAGGACEGIPVLSFSELKGRFAGALIIVTIGKRERASEVLAQLRAGGFPPDAVASDCFYLLTGDEVDGLLNEHIESLEAVYRALGDARSREVYLAKVNYMLSGDPIFLDGISDSDQYFCRDIITLQKNCIFVDGGGYDGANTVEFMRLVGGDGAKAYIFEPDPANLARISGNVGRLTNVSVLPIATWSHDCELRMSLSSGRGSAVSKAGGSAIQARSIDSVLGGARVDFIKMDVEGAEYESLLGAERTIREFRPTLAVCIYHSFEDHWRIPLLICSMCPGYSFYVRNHYDSSIETVFYAVPTGR